MCVVNIVLHVIGISHAHTAGYVKLWYGYL